MMESTILDGYSKEKAAFYLSPVTHLITIFLRARRAVLYGNVKFPTKNTGCLRRCPIRMQNDTEFRGGPCEKNKSLAA